MFVQHQSLRDELVRFLFVHFREDDEALLFILYEAIKRIMTKCVEFHPAPDTFESYEERRVADLTLERYF